MRGWRRVVPCVIGLVCLVGPWPISPHSFSQDEGQRERLLRAFQVERARRREELTKHLANHPRDFSAHFELGQLYALDDHIREAIREYRTAIAIAPDHATARFNLGLLYHRSGQLDEAIQAFQEVLRLDPTDLPAHINLAMVYRDKGGELLPKEIEILEAAVHLRPDYPEAHYHLGIAYRAMADRGPDCRIWYEKARREFTEYLAAKPAGKHQQTVSRWITALERRLEDC